MSQLEQEAALRIQNWWRNIMFHKHVINESRKEFDDLCKEIGDQLPSWPERKLCLPKFINVQEYEELNLRKAYFSRLSILKYEEVLKNGL